MELKDTNPILHNPILIWYLDLRARYEVAYRRYLSTVLTCCKQVSQVQTVQYLKSTYRRKQFQAGSYSTANLKLVTLSTDF